MLKIILLSLFYGKDVLESYNQVNNSDKLLNFLNISTLPSLKPMKEIYSRYSESKYLELTLKSINKLQFKNIRELKTIVIDSTSITLDLKFDDKHLSKQC
ncbi:MAG: hypothetical protein LBM96_08845 [Methanobrevibacter sp.]|jgi:hypothetical protein|nr:hypothetical protein [Candidatus Methanoflexus mossambicus]